MAFVYQPKFTFDGVLTDEATLGRPLLRGGLFFPRGVFETIRVCDGRLAFLADHHARISASCAALGFPWSVPLETLKRRVLDVAQANQFSSGPARVTVFLDEDGRCREVIAVREARYTGEMYQRGFRLKTVVDTARPAGPAHKSTDYAKNLRAREIAVASGCDEALFLSPEGYVLEGAATNVWIVQHGELLTPPLPLGILPGVARQQILTRWTESPIREERITLDQLLAADEVFVTNALLGVMPVSAVNHRVYSRYGYRITPELAAQFGRWQQASFG